MKKLFTLLLLTLAAFTFKATAQNTSCNAEFATQYLSNNVVKFNPVVLNDTIHNQHAWWFGDGGTASIYSPTHTYTTAGTYTVQHVIRIINSNGVAVCTDTFWRTVVIQGDCNLQANFTNYTDSLDWKKIHFTNTSIPFDPTDSTKWNFGDGTSSNDANPVHVYANAGTYNVCLTVKKNNSPPGTTPCVRYICKTVIVSEPCNLVVNFSWATTSATNPLVIHFTNLSVPLAPTDSSKWTFGDGTSSNDVNPTHTYLQPGTYTVCLTVKKNNAAGVAPCVRYICKSVTVYGPCNLVVSYQWHADSVNTKKIYFNNTSTPSAPTDSLTWNFGDGTTLSGLQVIPSIANPYHIYANAGVYNVCLIVKKNLNTAGGTPCTRYICSTITIVEPCTLVANFTSAISTTNSLTVIFTNTSTPLAATDSIKWNFGDGTSSNAVSPSHTYANAGTYNVCLRVQKRNSLGVLSTCVKEICHTVTVIANCNIPVNWSWHADSLNKKKIYFTNQTVTPTGSATAQWFFGDGSSATSWNAVHEYAQPGRYYVCLRVEFGPNCVKYKCDSITILPNTPPCNESSNFTYVKSSTNNQVYTFTPAFQSPAATYIWTFGDGTSSNAMIATHQYAMPGTYTVCLTVVRTNTCASTTCKTLVVSAQLNCDSIHVTYTYQKDPFVPNKVYFYAISNFPILDQTWTIRKMPISLTANPVILHQNNPVYVFPDTGYYQVCLRAITLGGCIKEYCNTIHIEHVGSTTQCTLQAYPNPATTQVSVNVTLGSAQMINVYVYNTLNILVKEKHQQGVTGNNVVTVEVGDLTPGQYTMKVIHGNDICYSHFQKL